MDPRKNRSGKVPIYDESLKIAAAREYLTSDLSYGKVAKKYQLKNSDVVKWFVKWYRRHHGTELSVSSTSPPSQSSSEPVQVKELQKQLRDANLKIAALEIMIELTEKDLGIDIRKKGGTKQ